MTELFLLLAGLTNAYIKGAKIHGAFVYENCPVSSINVNSSKSVQSVTVSGSKKVLLSPLYQSSILFGGSLCALSALIVLLHLCQFSLYFQILTGSVVLATGAWSRDICKPIGVEIPTLVNKHSYIISGIIPGIAKYPNVRYQDESIYIKVRKVSCLFTFHGSSKLFAESKQTVDCNLQKSAE